MNTFSKDQLIAALDRIDRDDSAKLKQSSESPTTDIYVETFDLSSAVSINAPKIISYPFKAFLIRDASDSNAYVNFLFDNRLGLNGSGSQVKKNSFFNNPFPLASAYFWWPAQTGKTVTIEFYRRGYILPGNFTTSISQVFSSVETTAGVSTVTSAAALILAADTDRKRALIQNQGSIPIYVGGSTVTAKAGARPGQMIDSGQGFVFDNTAALYAITDGGTNANVAIQVFK